MSFTGDPRISLALFTIRRGSNSDRIGMALTDALDDLISEGRIAPQLAMKILNNFDRHVTEVLSEKVKANLTFKVCLRRKFVGLGGRLRVLVGKPRYIPLLRRGVDFPHQKCHLQISAAGWKYTQRYDRKDQDCVL